MVPTLHRSLNPHVELFRELDRACSPSPRPASVAVDIHETDQAFVIEADLPGFGRESLDIQVDAGILSLTASRQAKEDRGEAKLAERRTGEVSRAFRLPESVDPEAISAKLEHGVLTLTLNKRDEVKPRKVEVN